MTPQISPASSLPRDGDAPEGAPWWKHGHVWLLISGPAAVVVAGFATLYLAIATPDPVVAEDYYRKGLEINKTLAERDRALLPALQGRNHAATPAKAP
jgi:hypothetical protein